MLPDGGTYEPSKYQTYLNGCWAEMITKMRKWRPDTIVLLGDIIQGGDPRKDMQSISPMRSVHCQVAYRLLEPLLSLKATWYWVSGTAWHEGQHSDDVRMLASKLKCKPHPVTGSPVWSRLYLTMGDRLVDFAHHVSTSGTRQSQATAVLRDAYNHKLELYNKFGNQLPPLGVLVRGHNHTGIIVEGDGVIGMRCPGWQLSTAFNDAKTNAIISDIGYGRVWLENGKIRADLEKHQPPLPHVEVSA